MVMHAEDLKPPKDLLLFTIEQHSLKLDKILEKIGDIDDRLIRIEERIGFKDKLVISIVNNNKSFGGFKSSACIIIINFHWHHIQQ